MKLHVYIWIAALLVTVSINPAFSQSKESEPEPGSVADTVNPAKAKARFFLRNEFREREDGAQINITEPLFDLPLTDNLVLRMQLPYVFNNQANGPTSNGIGDLTTNLYYRYKRGGGKSYFAALDVRWDTASEPTLGVGRTLVGPTWFASINVPKYDTILFPLVQTYFTATKRNDKANDITYTALKWRSLTKLENRFYTFAEMAVFIDHEDSNDSTGVLELELGRFANKQTMIYARPGVGLWGNTLSRYLFDWNFEIGYRYFFK